MSTLSLDMRIPPPQGLHFCTLCLEWSPLRCFGSFPHFPCIWLKCALPLQGTPEDSTWDWEPSSLLAWPTVLFPSLICLFNIYYHSDMLFFTNLFILSSLWREIYMSSLIFCLFLLNSCILYACIIAWHTVNNE